jgi:hypothetical protein
MASSSSCSNLIFTLPTLQFNGVKLESPNNYLVWLSQVVPVLKCHDLMGLADGSESCPQKILCDESSKEVPSPEYTIWNKKDQFLLSWINITLFEKVFSTIYGFHSSKQVWTALANRFASQSCSHISHLKRQIQSLQQGSKTCT